MSEADDVRARWLAEAQQTRAKLAPVGVASPDAVRGLTGLEVFAAIFAGRLPAVPIGHLLDFVPIEVEYGRIVFQGHPAFEHYNPLGSVHGGYIATLLDSAVGCAIHSTLPAGRGYTTLELKVNMVRAITVATGPVRAEGKIIHVGRQTGVAEGRLSDAQGRLLAWASTTCLIFDVGGKTTPAPQNA